MFLTNNVLTSHWLKTYHKLSTSPPLLLLGEEVESRRTDLPVIKGCLQHKELIKYTVAWKIKTKAEGFLVRKVWLSKVLL